MWIPTSRAGSGQAQRSTAVSSLSGVLRVIINRLWLPGGSGAKCYEPRNKRSNKLLQQSLLLVRCACVYSYAMAFPLRRHSARVLIWGGRLLCGSVLSSRLAGLVLRERAACPQSPTFNLHALQPALGPSSRNNNHTHTHTHTHTGIKYLGVIIIQNYYHKSLCS